MRAQGRREKRVVVFSSKKMKSPRFRGRVAAHTGERGCEVGGAFFKVGGMRGVRGCRTALGG